MMNLKLSLKLLNNGGKSVSAALNRLRSIYCEDNPHTVSRETRLKRGFRRPCIFTQRGFEFFETIIVGIIITHPKVRKKAGKPAKTVREFP